MEAANGLIVVGLPTLKMAREMIRKSRPIGSVRSLVGRVNRILLASSQRLELHVAGAMIVEMGETTRSGVLRMFGFERIRLYPFRLVRWRARV
jgi:hypothetical protein